MDNSGHSIRHDRYKLYKTRADIAIVKVTEHGTFVSRGHGLFHIGTTSTDEKLLIKGTPPDMAHTVMVLTSN